MAQLNLLALVAVHLALIGLPGVAGALFAARRGVRVVPILVAIALAASGAVAMLCFWAYFAGHPVGEILSGTVVIGSLPVIGWAVSSHDLDSVLLRQLATPLLLWALGSAFLVFLGFVHGGTTTPLSTAAARFRPYLPSDNDIPHYFTDWFYLHGHHGIPPLFPGGWSATDRPPLEVGYDLSQRAIAWDALELNYQVIGVILQQLWIPALWALLLAARSRRVTGALVMVTVLLSDLAIVNGFFIWPKMLGAAMLIAAAALVVTPLWSELRRRPWAAALIGTLLALAMLAHGSSLFGVIPLGAVAAARGLPSWRWLATGALVGAVLLVPWSMYQRYGDPPGNRLAKEAFAGVGEIDHNSTYRDIVDAYRRAGFGGTLHNKAQNFVTIAGGGQAVNFLRNTADAFASGHVADGIQDLRNMLFLYPIPSMGLLVFAPLFMLVARARRRIDSPDWHLALACYAVAVGGEVVSAVLLFGGAAVRAVLHQSSYVLPLLAFCGAVAGLRGAFPRFAVYFVLVSDFLMFAIYVPALKPAAGSSYSLFGAFIAVASLAGFGMIALHDTLIEGRRGLRPLPVRG
jgi:hypothetical protein